jgi:AbrB family looped-hinge helix DNA binding protein
MSISKTTAKGHVVVPAELRRKFNIKKGTKVSVSEGKGNVIIIRPIPDDPIEASRGMLKGKSSLLKSLLKDRHEETRRG